MTSYEMMLRTFLSELKMTEEHKKKMIVKLAEQLEKERLVAMEDINKKLTEDLKGYVTKQWIGQVLPKKFKDAEKIHVGEQKAKASEMKMLVQVGETGIETTAGDLNDEVDRIRRKTEKDESDEFGEELKRKLDEHHINPTDINQNIYRELQEKIEQVERLKTKNLMLNRQYSDLDDKIKNLKRYVGCHVLYDENLRVLEYIRPEETDSVNLNLIKFKDKLQDYINRNIAMVMLEHDRDDVLDIK